MSVSFFRRQTLLNNLSKGNNFNDGTIVAPAGWTPPGSPTIYINPNNSTSYPGSGTTVYDLSGNGNNGTLVNGPTYTSGTPSYFSFDGTNDYLTYSTTINPITGDLSFAFWCYLNSVSGQKTLLSSWSDTGNNRSWMQTQDGVYPVWYWDRSGNFSNQRNITGSPISATTWYFFAATYNATTGDCKAYINNVAQSTATFSGAGSLYATSAAVEQARQQEPSRYMAGRMGEMILYKSVLSVSDIDNIWTNTKTKYGY